MVTRYHQLQIRGKSECESPTEDWTLWYSEESGIVPVVHRQFHHEKDNRRHWLLKEGQPSQK